MPKIVVEEGRTNNAQNRAQLLEKENKASHKNDEQQENQHSGFQCTIEDDPVYFDNSQEVRRYYEESYDCYDEEMKRYKEFVFHSGE